MVFILLNKHQKLNFIEKVRVLMVQNKNYNGFLSNIEINNKNEPTEFKNNHT